MTEIKKEIKNFQELGENEYTAYSNRKYNEGSSKRQVHNAKLR